MVNIKWNRTENQPNRNHTTTKKKNQTQSPHIQGTDTLTIHHVKTKIFQEKWLEPTPIVYINIILLKKNERDRNHKYIVHCVQIEYASKNLIKKMWGFRYFLVPALIGSIWELSNIFRAFNEHKDELHITILISNVVDAKHGLGHVFK